MKSNFHIIHMHNENTPLTLLVNPNQLEEFMYKMFRRGIFHILVKKGNDRLLIDYMLQSNLS